MINYLNARPKVQGALFCHLSHKYLTRYQVVSVLKSAEIFHYDYSKPIKNYQMLM
jgi:hypothetical protein